MNVNILMARSSALVAPDAYEHLKDILTEKMRVVVLGFSFFGNLSKEKYFEYYGKNSEYALKIADNFKPYNIENIDWVYYYDMDQATSIELIKNADILYFPGGAPDLMYERIIEKGLLEILTSFNKIIIGSSAGAMIQLAKYHISPDYDYHKFSLHKGLGYLDEFFIEVHYNRRKKQKSSMRKVRRLFKKPIYIIPDDGLLIVKNKKDIICINTSKKMYNPKGIER